MDGVHDPEQSKPVSVTMLTDSLYHVVDSEHNILVTSDSFMHIDRRMSLISTVECIANPYVFGHGRATDPTNCWLQGNRAVDIKPVKGKVA